MAKVKKRGPTDGEILDGIEPDAAIVDVIGDDGGVIASAIEDAPEPPRPAFKVASVFGKLTDAKIKAAIRAAAEGKGSVISDGAGLYLRIFPGSARKPQWLYKYAANGKRKSVTLGSFPAVSIQAARKLAQVERDRKAIGFDPATERRREKTRRVPTFAEAAEAYFAENKDRWREDGEHRKRWIAVLEKHAFPILGNMPIDQIETPDVLNALTPEFWRDKPGQSRRVLQRIRVVFARSKALGHYKGDNPAGEAVDAVRHPNPAVKRHIKALDPGEIADALAAVEASTSSEAVKLAFRFGILCASRFIEIRQATWGEIDLEAARWRIPAGKMKMDEPHDVPLSSAALECLERAKALRADQSPGALLFPSPRSGKPISSDTLRKMLEKLGMDAKPHGIARATFRTWCAEQGVDFFLAEAALAHSRSGVHAAYDRSTLYRRRIPLMQQWGEFVTGGTDNSGNVIPINRAVA